jgi:hypothetical protein
VAGRRASWQASRQRGDGTAAEILCAGGPEIATGKLAELFVQSKTGEPAFFRECTDAAASVRLVARRLSLRGRLTFVAPLDAGATSSTRSVHAATSPLSILFFPDGRRNLLCL